MAEKSKKSIISEKQNRVFSEELKKKLVLDISGKVSRISDICLLYEVSRTAVHKWIRQYSVDYQRQTKTVVQMESEGEKTRILYREKSELLQVLGQKQLEIDYLQRLLSIAGEELGMDLKKNFGTKASVGLENIGKNTLI